MSEYNHYNKLKQTEESHEHDISEKKHTRLYG